MTSTETVPPELDEMGPIDFLVVEFPQFKVTGEALAQLLDLVDRGLIRVLDLVFVRKDEDGRVQAVTAHDLAADAPGELDVFDGAASGLLGHDDITEAAEVLLPGSAGGILVYENRWAAPFARTLRRNGAQLVASGRIPVQAVLAAFDAADHAST